MMESSIPAFLLAYLLLVVGLYSLYFFDFNDDALLTGVLPA